MQRLPSHRIQRAHELSEVDLEEDPAPACLCSRDQATLRARANLLGMHVQEGGGFVESESPQRGGLGPSRIIGAVSAGINDLVWFRSFRVEVSRVAP